jgi:hypothetical protein
MYLNGFYHGQKGFASNKKNEKNEASGVSPPVLTAI